MSYLPMNIHNNNNNQNGDNKMSKIKDWFSPILTIATILISGAVYLKSMENKIDNVAKGQTEILLSFKENQVEFKSLTKIIQQHEIDLATQKEKNINIYDKIKAADEKTESIREAVITKGRGK